ncbi:class I SAM-dependent methyltransferase [Paenibacillus faecalis]|uniref:class I SAM-dependent methyltransferase n=1 Tax=Paenibacillus faecalis TaxID=2079532 RepID=UPI000D0E5709|nr:class I SAM-dependent methyltransferase [Paenibacillus faecalis]
MAIVQLTSRNPQFSFLIKKNPESGMQLRSLRQGMAYGWYSEPSVFNVYFKDADNDISYKQHQGDSFEYLNVSRYNTPLFPLAAISEFFSAPFRKQDERDVDGYEHIFFINLIHIEKLHYIEFFRKHLDGYTFTLRHEAHKSYALTISTRKGLYDLLHTVSVLSLFLSMFGNEYLDTSDAVLEKYIRSLNVIDAPYYIRSLFVRNFLNNRKRFKKYKHELEQTEKYSIDFAYGNTAMQRRSYIASVLPLNKPILDIGCGEGFYALSFAGKMDDSYYAVDVNEDVLAVVERKARVKELDNLVTYPSLSHFLETYNEEMVDVILTEVIEHMPVEEAAEFIQQIVHKVQFEKLVITTPNADFNRYYELARFRHDDHQWEMGQDEFRSWISEILQNQAVQYEYVMIGDGVDGMHTTQGVIVMKGE